MAPAMSIVENDPAWTLTPTVRGALDLLEASRAHGLANLDDTAKPVGLLGAQEYTPDLVAFAKRLQSGNSNDLAKAVCIYAQDARFAAGGSGLTETPTPAESFDRALPGRSETGAFGPVFREYSGKPTEAMAKLQQSQAGDVPRVWQNAELARVDPHGRVD
jgi:hypothetical protein